MWGDLGCACYSKILLGKQVANFIRQKFNQCLLFNHVVRFVRLVKEEMGKIFIKIIFLDDTIGDLINQNNEKA